jgi:hypothetical protein
MESSPKPKSDEASRTQEQDGRYVRAIQTRQDAISLSTPLQHQPSERELLYQRLDPTKNEIRLLKILPIRVVEGDEYGVIECTLSVTSLDGAPPYHALSYAWGDQSNPGEIFLDGQPFPVGRNLEWALWEFQTHSKITFFWIDALCINQNDEVERTEQVRKMRTIYERAENVVVWLGKSFLRTCSAFALLENLYQHLLDTDYIANALKTEWDSLEELKRLFKEDYWYRIWVVQEVKAARYVTVQCGRYTIAWTKLKAVQEMLFSGHRKYIVQVSHEEPKLFQLDACITHRGVKALETPGDGPHSDLPDLYTILYSFSFKRATNPRDRIYALVGLTTARDDPRYVIDYSAPVRRVYTDCVK